MACSFCFTSRVKAKKCAPADDNIIPPPAPDCSIHAKKPFSPLFFYLAKIAPAIFSPTLWTRESNRTTRAPRRLRPDGMPSNAPPPEFPPPPFWVPPPIPHDASAANRANHRPYTPRAPAAKNRPPKSAAPPPTCRRCRCGRRQFPVRFRPPCNVAVIIGGGHQRHPNPRRH